MVHNFLFNRTVTLIRSANDFLFQKPDPPNKAPAASMPDSVLDFEESLDRKDGLMGSFS